MTYAVILGDDFVKRIHLAQSPDSQVRDAPWAGEDFNGVVDVGSVSLRLVRWIGRHLWIVCSPLRSPVSVLGRASPRLAPCPSVGAYGRLVTSQVLLKRLVTVNICLVVVVEPSWGKFMRKTCKLMPSVFQYVVSETIGRHPSISRTHFARRRSKNKLKYTFWKVT